MEGGFAWMMALAFVMCFMGARCAAILLVARPKGLRFVRR